MLRPLLILLLALAAAVPLRADAPTEQYLAGLRQRKLYELAERYCTERLQTGELPQAEQVELVIELSRTLAEHALDASPGEAVTLWERALEATEEFAARNPTTPRLLLVQLQGAMVRAAEGQAARQDARDDFGSPANQYARDSLRDAIQRLETVAEAVRARLSQQDVGPLAVDDLSTPELQSLELNVQLEMARALRNQALCYPPGSADRINSLTRAGEALAPLARHKVRNELYWSAALERLARMRLSGDYTPAERLLNELSQQRPPATIAQRIRAERIRLALQHNRVDDALAEAGAAGDRAPSPELDFARLEALLAAWKRDSERGAKEATEWQRRAVAQGHHIRRAYGGQWMRRADALLASAVAGSDGPQTSATLAFTATGYYRSGQLDKALATFDAAAGKAREEQQPDRAFDAALSAATIKKEQGQYQGALDRFRKLALDAPEHAQAAAAHLQAAHCAAQLARAQQPPNLDAYRGLLREHVETWPKSETASQAWSWLGRLAEHDRQWPAAIELLAQVNPADPQYPEAVEAIGRCYEAWLAEVHASGKDGRALADQALAALEAVIEGQGRQSGLSAASRAATLSAARIWLTEMPTGATPAERLLQSALKAEPEAPAAWQSEARRWRIPALTLLGKGAQADAAIDELPPTSDQMLSLLQTIAVVRRRQGADDAQAKLAKLELSLQNRLLAAADQLDGNSLRGVRRARAMTLAETGQRAGGLAELRQLALESPRDGKTHEALAEVLADGSGAELEEALSAWTDVARKSRPGTARWFRAHYQLARVQHKLGQAAAARGTIEHVRQRYSALGGPEMKPRFEALWNELAR